MKSMSPLATVIVRIPVVNEESTLTNRVPVSVKMPSEVGRLSLRGAKDCGNWKLKRAAAGPSDLDSLERAILLPCHRGIGMR